MKVQVKPRKQPRQARSLAMVDTILDATARVLVRESYAKASTNAVAEAAGISVGSLYQYFPNKDSLITALHARHVQQVQQEFTKIIGKPGPTTLAQTVKDIIHAVVEAHRIEPELHRIIDSEVPHLVRDTAWDDTHAEFRDTILLFIRKYRDEIKVKNARMAAFMVGEIVHAVIHAAVIDEPEGIGIAAVERETVKTVLAYLTTEA